MRILDAIPAETQLDQKRTIFEDEVGPGWIGRPLLATCEASRDESLRPKGTKELGLETQHQPTRRSEFGAERERRSIRTVRNRGNMPARLASTRAAGLLVALFMLLRPAAAVIIEQWSNCLPEPSNSSEPKGLQWVPLYVGAVFDNDNSSHNLRVTVWGNVTGSYDRSANLPAWNDPLWDNASYTEGKIVDNPFPTTAARLTTLHDTIDVLTYEPYADDFDFCHGALTNASCPLGPVFNTTNMYVFTRLVPRVLFLGG